MKRFAIGAALLAIGLALGVAAGRRRFREAPASAPAEPAASEPSPEPDLASLRSELDDLHARLAAPAGVSAPPSPRATLAELLARAGDLKARKDGPGLLLVLKELASLGEPGFRASWELEQFLDTLSHEELGAFGIDFNLVWKTVCAYLVPAAEWALAPDSGAPSAWRARAVDVVGSAEEHAGRNGHMDRFFASILTESDPAVARAMACYLNSAGESDADRLIAAARAQASHDGAVRHLLNALGRWDRPDILAALQEFARADDTPLGQEAAIQLVRLRPPVAGRWVSYFYDNAPASHAGFLRGDILVSVNHVPLDSDRAWRDARRALAPGSPVTVIVHRAGVPIEIRGTLSDLDGMLSDTVTPK